MGKLKKLAQRIGNVAVESSKSMANVATAGQVNKFGGTGALSSDLLLGSTTFGTGSGVHKTYSQIQEGKSIDAANEALASQKEEQASAEKAKYQAMVDANFSDVAKKRSRMTGRPGSGLYAGLSGGAGGLYNI